MNPLSQFAMDTSDATVSSTATQASMTLNNLDTTFSIPAQQKPVIDTLTKLYNETCAVLGGAQASGDKKQEIKDNWLKLLFALLKDGEISENASKHLVELCRMLDRRDFGTAYEILASLSTSHGNECNSWMLALKRMLNTRVNGATSPNSHILSPQQVTEQLRLQQQAQQQRLQQQQAQHQQLLQQQAQQQQLLQQQAHQQQAHQQRLLQQMQQRLGVAQVAQLQASHQSPKTLNTMNQGSFMPQARGSGLTNNGVLPTSTQIQPSNPSQPAAVQPVFIPTLTQARGSGVTNNGVLPTSTQIQPSNPGQPAAAQPVFIPTLSPQNVDTSSVPDQQKPVITTLTRLLNETNGAKKQEIQDNITKMTALFGKLNRGEISANVAEKIVELCQALDRGDFAAALQNQVLLSANHWGECNLWLGSLKRMTKQNERNQESFFA